METKFIQDMYPYRRQIRLPSYDYASQGAYFVTICTQNRRHLFGSIQDCQMHLNEYGKIVESVWNEIPLHYAEVANEVFIVMPNHIHGILVIERFGRAGLKPAPTSEYALSEIIRGFKTYSARRVNHFRNSKGMPLWQRGYYEHVVRDETDYEQIGEYVLSNAAKWNEDPENSEGMAQL